MKKNDTTVYVVVRRNPDLNHHMVEIKGIFTDKNEADKFRGQVWDVTKQETTIETYQLLDLVSPP